jgi:predicted membrane-bound spermidine synthase
MRRLLYALFFCSGISGLVYQVVWVRHFANVFGNTVYSASVVTAVFMSGLGVGGYVTGRWADRLYAARATAPLEAYAKFEVLIALFGALLALIFPHLEPLSTSISQYAAGAHGWMEISAGSSIVRCVVAVVLLAPVTALMGGTLTLLIRHVVGAEVGSSGFRIGMLYAMNTAGAALGCLLTDFLLVPSLGLMATQEIAVVFNLVAAVGARWLASQPVAEVARPAPPTDDGAAGLRPIAGIAAALFFTGFAGMGFELVWLRHFISVLGPFRFVFSLLLAVILVGMWAGSALAAVVERRVRRPAALFAAAQVLLVVVALAALRSLERVDVANATRAAEMWGDAQGGVWRSVAAYWSIARPVLLGCGLPAVLMGSAFPLANAHAQRASSVVGVRAGFLYLVNTLGAVVGSILCGLVLLPAVGTQKTVLVVAAFAVASLVPLAASIGFSAADGARRTTASLCALAAVGVVALGAWARQPSDWLLLKVILTPPGSKRVAVSEGIGETIVVVERGTDRILLVNGFPMSGTSRDSQRYMRLFVHMPLLLSERPRESLVICFGVGNTLSAMLLHDSLERVDLVDVSKHVLEQANYFRSTNHGAIEDPRVHVHVNDGRQHLRMKAPQSYDLVTLEPPPLPHAGVAGLYSREFYELVRSRLRPGGMMTQWLPMHQLTTEATRAVIRAFIDVFPTSVLLSGARTEFILLGVNGPAFGIDPGKVKAKIDSNPALRDELRAINVDDLTDLFGTFAASAFAMNAATAGSPPVSDDEPITEYISPTALHHPERAPAGLFDADGASRWCPRCFAEPPVERLEGYLGVTNALFTSDGFFARKRASVRVTASGKEAVDNSSYLRMLLSAPSSEAR